MGDDDIAASHGHKVSDVERVPAERRQTLAERGDASSDAEHAPPLVPKHAPADSQHAPVDGARKPTDSENKSEEHRKLSSVAPPGLNPKVQKSAVDGSNVIHPHKRAWQELLQERGLPHSVIDSFLKDISRDDDFEKKLREHVPQEEADELLAKVVSCALVS